ncbi:Cof-type HAD-IIB family hydrolase [Halobacillus shinanisalinarum]|uniref:Cof-type HAD-IIB family hydrolase n=1 Tax=Halobacillus shinanisalinarum TaxID=2932258 RepID=A0ABY4H4U2_9BACI|nr:Cof-type HAD-IIB family hydrolase [Halobacillus shinanisalinarum]UOQ95488.1 Cof-type HAD-IIB family hydrolase [Halobacillus shinanisalinarum]
MKIIAIDLDGTLLNSRSKISEENIAAIKEAQSKGVEVVIATGRAEFDVREVFAKTGVSTWVIGANGATIHQPDGKCFDSVPIDPNDGKDILQWLEQEQFYYEVFSESAILTPQNGLELLNIELDRIRSANPQADVSDLKLAMEKQFGQQGFVHVDSYQEILAANVPLYNVLAFSFDQAKLDLGWRQFELREDLTLVSSSLHNFELENKNASKGIALSKLAKHFGVNLGDVGAIGDSPNDLSMLQVAGHSAAMLNGRDVVKEASEFITKSNDEHGVAHAISQWLN